jgi:hypothetical protein
LEDLLISAYNRAVSGAHLTLNISGFVQIFMAKEWFMPVRNLDRVQISVPCTVGWEKMTGDNRARFCRECQRDVHNFSKLTRAEIEALLLKSKGRLCGRIERRVDGTIVTAETIEENLTTFQFARHRASRFVGATFAALLSLCSSIGAQTPTRTTETGASSQQTIVNRNDPQPPQLQTQDDGSSISGTVLDPNGAVVPGATVTLTNKNTNRSHTIVSDGAGQFRFGSLVAGVYNLRTEVLGFGPSETDNIVLRAAQESRLDVILEFATTEITVGIIATDFGDSTNDQLRRARVILSDSFNDFFERRIRRVSPR